MITDIEAPNRADAEVEGAMALLGSGLSSIQVSTLTGIPASTLRDWARSATLVTKYSEAIKQFRIQIALRTSQLAMQTLDAIEDGTVKVSPLQAFTMWGISTDKIQKDETQPGPVAPVSVFVGVHVSNDDKATDIRKTTTTNGTVTPVETIEGTAREVGQGRVDHE